MQTIEAVNPIRDARRRARFSQARLAQAAGLHYATVQQAEAGRRVSPVTLEKIAQALGVEPEQLR